MQKIKKWKGLEDLALIFPVCTNKSRLGKGRI
jgi:hypothetical protein